MICEGGFRARAISDPDYLRSSSSSYSYSSNGDPRGLIRATMSSSSSSSIGSIRCDTLRYDVTLERTAARRLRQCDARRNTTIPSVAAVRRYYPDDNPKWSFGIDNNLVPPASSITPSLSAMSRDYDRRRGGSGSGSSSKLRMDANVSQTRPHGESSGKRRELDTVMRKARESQSSYWNKKLLEVEERDPNRWRHSGYKELYVGGTASGKPSRSHPRSPRSPRPPSPHSPRPPRSPRARSPRSPRERSHTRGRPARSPSTGSTCSDRSCSVCSPKERRRVAPPSRSRSRSITPIRGRAHPKEVIPSSSRAMPPRTRPRSPPLPRPRTPPPAPQPPPRHQKDYKTLKEKEAKIRRKEKHHTRLPEDPRVPDQIPLMRKPVKVEKSHASHSTSQMMRPPPESSPSEDSDSSSTTSHVGPPRMTLSERFGKMAQWSVDRRDMENMRITKDGENAMKVVIEGEERIARLGYDSPPPGHYPESLLAQGPRGLECWDDVRVRYDYYKARGYLRDLSLDDYIKWEEWWYKYQEWLEAERFYEQWASSNRPSGGSRKRRGRRNNTAH